MPGPRRLAVLAAAIVLLVATIAFAARGGPGGPGETADGPTGSAEGSSAGAGDPDGGNDGGSGDGAQDADASEGDTSGDGDGDNDGDQGGEGGDGATEARNEPPPTTAPDAKAPLGTKKQPIPGVAPNGDLVPVPTDAGPGETLGTSGKDSTKDTGQPAPVLDTSPLVSTPLPKTASSRGRLVKGFPAKALPVVPRSKVRSSSVSSSGRALQVALVGSAPARPDAVAAFYRLKLGRYGFTESPVRAVGGSTAMAFRRSGDSLVLTLTREGKNRSTYSLYGVLRAGSD